ncbi:hypothetical protein QJS10_CPB04g02009 [Acorus calamus]|uniref:RPA-interacting protein central domain-containing protein n=1 Tax=Acorus calamus TaxID=4465 RepID=A0AAV9F2B3_ACOCL|nr:hypothetical protein QJS10_CPB04g02009 [Acorus calamus]
MGSSIHIKLYPRGIRLQPNNLNGVLGGGRVKGESKGGNEGGRWAIKPPTRTPSRNRITNALPNLVGQENGVGSGTMVNGPRPLVQGFQERELTWKTRMNPSGKSLPNRNNCRASKKNMKIRFLTVEAKRDLEAREKPQRVAQSSVEVRLWTSLHINKLALGGRRGFQTSSSFFAVLVSAISTGNPCSGHTMTGPLSDSTSTAASSLGGSARRTFSSSILTSFKLISNCASALASAVEEAISLERTPPTLRVPMARRPSMRSGGEGVDKIAGSTFRDIISDELEKIKRPSPQDGRDITKLDGSDILWEYDGPQSDSQSTVSEREELLIEMERLL